jgi:chaperone modulatory protein CbpM
MTTILLDAHGGCADIDLTVEELACASSTDEAWVIHHVREDILPARPGEPHSWRFGSAELQRARRVASIERMFEVDSEVAAFIADLIEEIQRLKAH